MSADPRPSRRKSPGTKVYPVGRPFAPPPGLRTPLPVPIHSEPAPETPAPPLSVPDAPAPVVNPFAFDQATPPPELPVHPFELSPPTDLVYSIEEPATPPPAPPSTEPKALKATIKGALVAAVVLLCVGAGLFVLGPRPGRKVKASGEDVVAQLDPKDSDLNAGSGDPSARGETPPAKSEPAPVAEKPVQPQVSIAAVEPKPMMPEKSEKPESIESKPPTTTKKPRKPSARPTKTEAKPEPKPEMKPEPKPAPMVKPADPEANHLTFEKHILPIFEAKCVNCHGAAKKKAGVDVRTVAAMVKGGEDKGGTLVRGSITKSALWHSIEEDRMPPGKNRKLTADEKELIRKWIMTGAKEARTVSAK